MDQKNNIKIKRVFKPHISKRNGMVWYKSWIIRIASLILAFLVSAVIIMLLLKQNPLQVFNSMIKGNFETPRTIWKMLRDMSILLCISLAVTPAFKMRFWNIGAEGQVLVGALAATACMFSLGDKIDSNALLILIMLVSSMAAGIAWAMIPAFFKSIWNTNETLFTLMMNYVAIQLVSFMIAVWVPNGSQVMGVINSKDQKGWLPEIDWFKGSSSKFLSLSPKFLLPIIVVAGVMILMFVYLRYTKHGYELSVVGESENTAKYVGINVKKVILRTLALSGAVCGIAGFLIVGGIDHTVNTGSAGGNGFTAIMVSWLAKFNPLIMALTSFIISFLQHGASQIATDFKIDTSLADIVTGIILFFIIGSEFFINYKINLFVKHEEDAK